MLAPFVEAAAPAMCANAVLQDSQPLVCAAAVGDVGVVAALLRAGAAAGAVSANNIPRGTALELATRHDHVGVIALLARGRRGGRAGKGGGGGGGRLPASPASLAPPGSPGSPAMSPATLDVAAAASGRGARRDRGASDDGPHTPSSGMSTPQAGGGAPAAQGGSGSGGSGGGGGGSGKGLPTGKGLNSRDSAGVSSTPIVQLRPAIITVTRQVRAAQRAARARARI